MSEFGGLCNTEITQYVLKLVKCFKVLEMILLTKYLYYTNNTQFYWNFAPEQ